MSDHRDKLVGIDMNTGVTYIGRRSDVSVGVIFDYAVVPTKELINGGENYFDGAKREYNNRKVDNTRVEVSSGQNVVAVHDLTQLLE